MGATPPMGSPGPHDPLLANRADGRCQMLWAGSDQHRVALRDLLWTGSVAREWPNMALARALLHFPNWGFWPCGGRGASPPLRHRRRCRPLSRRRCDAGRGRGSQAWTYRRVGYADDGTGTELRVRAVLHAQADELAADGFSALAAWCDSGLETIAYLLGSTLTRDHRTIFASDQIGREAGVIRGATTGLGQALVGPGE